MASVWELAAADVLPQLDAGLAGYFGALPDGKVGLGRGSFQQVGTPRRWLWPVLWLLAREGIVFPVWQQRVPFEVCNRPGHDRRGRATLSATRTFHFRNGSKVMPDSIAVEADGSLTDCLGKHGWLAVFADRRGPRRGDAADRLAGPAPGSLGLVEDSRCGVARRADH